jgi:uncharacterized protein YjbK
MRGVGILIESTEKELKYLVEKNEFYTLKEYLDTCGFYINTIVQTNYYLDTYDYSLRSNGITLKIREISSQDYVITMKTNHAEVNNNLHIKKEYNIKIDKEYFDFIKNSNIISINHVIPDQIKSVIEDIDKISEVRIQGYLTTERILYKIPNFNEPILLDKNIYLNTVDYEIEWETEKIDSSRQMIKDLFDRFKIIPQINSLSKSCRFSILQHK